MAQGTLEDLRDGVRTENRNPKHEIRNKSKIEISKALFAIRAILEFTAGAAARHPLPPFRLTHFLNHFDANGH
jgi:hypothetical protein